MSRYSHAGGVVVRPVDGERDDALHMLRFDDARRVLMEAHVL